MKTIVHPKYQYLSGLIEKIANEKIPATHIFCDHRNIVQKIEEKGETLVVKKYKHPTWVNTLVYSFFRKSKAQRAYEFALKLKEMHIETPDPVAYVEIKKYGLFHTGYFISKYIDYLPLSTIDTYPENQRQEVLQAFASFTVSLHKKGIMHRDYSTSNIMFRKENNEYHFALIDINRMRFKKMYPINCIQNFRRLGLSLNTQLYAICQYARLRHWNRELTFAAVLIHRNLINSLGKSKTLLKKWIKKIPYKKHLHS